MDQNDPSGKTLQGICKHDNQRIHWKAYLEKDSNIFLLKYILLTETRVMSQRDITMLRGRRSPGLKIDDLHLIVTMKLTLCLR